MQGKRRSLLILTATLALGSAGSAAATDAPQVLLKTSMGDITLELNQEKRPRASPISCST